MTLRPAAALLGLTLLTACAHAPVSPGLAQKHIDSGITANNGGGQNSTGGLVNSGVTTSTGPR